MVLWSVLTLEPVYKPRTLWMKGRMGRSPWTKTLVYHKKSFSPFAKGFLPEWLYTGGKIMIRHFRDTEYWFWTNADSSGMLWPSSKRRGLWKSAGQWSFSRSLTQWVHLVLNAFCSHFPFCKCIYFILSRIFTLLPSLVVWGLSWLERPNERCCELPGKIVNQKQYCVPGTAAVSVTLKDLKDTGVVVLMISGMINGRFYLICHLACAEGWVLENDNTLL